MTAKRSKPVKIAVGPPFETSELRKSLTSFLTQPAADSHSGSERRLGNFKFGVYAFYDYDGEPIYVGQTNEKLSTRIRRHLTNQRTDAVAMKGAPAGAKKPFQPAYSNPLKVSPSVGTWGRDAKRSPLLTASASNCPLLM